VGGDGAGADLRCSDGLVVVRDMCAGMAWAWLFNVRRRSRKVVFTGTVKDRTLLDRAMVRRKMMMVLMLALVLVLVRTLLFLLLRLLQV
jgi:hypothetical protein